MFLMYLGEDEAIAGGISRLLNFISHLVKEKHGKDLSSRHAGCGVSENIDN
jgi:hypothetical protein